MKKSIWKILALGLTGILLIGILSSCSLKKDNKKNDKLTVVAAMYPQYDFAKHIGGDKADVKLLIKPGTETHSFEPTPQDMKTLENCDLFIYTGGENDEWVDDLIKNLGDRAPKTLKLTDIVDTVDEEIVEGMEHHHDHDHEDHEHEDHDHEDHEHEDHDHEEHEHEEHDHEEHEHHHDVDEHVWTSPANAVEICNRICYVMSELDSDNASYYEKNCKQYTGEIKAVDKEIKDIVKNSKRKTIVVADRFPLRYFTEQYGLKYYAAFAGCSDQTEADASTIAFLIDKVKEESIPVVFEIELSNGKIADTVAEATGAEKRIFYSCHNVTRDQYKDGLSYVDMMKENSKSLKKALN